MFSVIFLAAAALFAAISLTPLVCRISVRLGIVDTPDGERKFHREPVPRTGGVAIAAAYLLAFALLLSTPAGAGKLVLHSLPLAFQLLPAAGLVFFAGLIDDVRGLPPWCKLAAELTAASMVAAAGVRIGWIGGYRLDPTAGALLTVFWIVACTNALNLIDGLDGLAAGIGLLATGTIVVAAFHQGNVALAMATVPLAGALAGFLLFNFNPAQIFLGDSGSLTVGFLLGCYGVLWGQKSTTAVGIAAPLIALGIPLADTGLAIARRFLRQQPIFKADAAHIHHRLLALGLTPRRVVLILYAACIALAGMSLLFAFAAPEARILVVIMFVVWTLVGINHLGYVEFGTVLQMLRAGMFRRHLNAYIHVRAMEIALRSAGSVDACWEAVRDASVKLGFDEAQMHLDGRLWQEGPPADAENAWKVTLPLPAGGRLMLSRNLAAGIGAPLPGSFALTLYRAIERNLKKYRVEEEYREAMTRPWERPANALGKHQVIH